MAGLKTEGGNYSEEAVVKTQAGLRVPRRKLQNKKTSRQRRRREERKQGQMAVAVSASLDLQHPKQGSAQNWCSVRRGQEFCQMNERRSVWSWLSPFLAGSPFPSVK